MVSLANTNMSFVIHKVDDTCPNFLPFSLHLRGCTLAQWPREKLSLTSILCTPAMPDAIDGDDLAQPGEEEDPSSPLIPTNDSNLFSAKEILELVFQNHLSHVDNADSSLQIRLAN